MAEILVIVETEMLTVPGGMQLELLEVSGQGPAGLTGPAGSAGSIGPRGLTGLTGPAGAAGTDTSVVSLKNEVDVYNLAREELTGVSAINAATSLIHTQKIMAQMALRGQLP